LTPRGGNLEKERGGISLTKMKGKVGRQSGSHRGDSNGPVWQGMVGTPPPHLEKKIGLRSSQGTRTTRNPLLYEDRDLRKRRVSM